ncbi:MAG: prepilin-type N-terminal cleavage/methylation domain-containing protein [Bacilli bacterium]|nr:prepilin-type N-terminal cleavage/methylation domain-containing protein [Bacilli bacterium]
MKKKGFTLIELLAVIIILAVIALITIPLITNMVNRSRLGAFGVTKKNIERAAELYFARNSDEVVWENDISYVTIGTLKSKKLLKNNVINNLNSTSINDDTKVLMYRSGRQIGYSLQLYDEPFFNWYQGEMIKASKETDIELPTNIGDIVTVDLDILMNKNLVDELRLPLELENRCVGYVEIEKTDNNYEYNAYVDCLQGASTFASHYVSYGGKYLDTFNDVKETSDGGFLAVGASNSEVITKYGNTSKGRYDGIIVKFKNDGTVEWSRNFGGSNDEHFNSVVEVSDGYVVVGNNSSSDKDLIDANYKGGISDGLIVKYNKQGQVVYLRSYGSSGDVTSEESFTKVILDGTDLIVIGHIYGTEPTGDLEGLSLSHSGEALIIKFNQNFDMLWRTFFRGNYAEVFNSIIKTKDNGYLVVGSSNSNSHDTAGIIHFESRNTEGIIVKYNNNGEYQNKYIFQGDMTDTFLDVIEVSDGYIVIGYSNSSNQEMGGMNKSDNSLLDAIIIKFNKELTNIMWKKSFGGSKNDIFYNIIKGSNNEFVVVGASNSEDMDMKGMVISRNGYKNSIILKYNIATGNIINHQTFGGLNSDQFKTIIHTSENKYIIVGETFSSDLNLKNFNKGHSDAIMVSYDKDFNLERRFQEPVVIIDKLKTIVPNYGTKINLKYDHIYTSNDPVKDFANWCTSIVPYLIEDTSNYPYGTCLYSFNEDDIKELFVVNNIRNLKPIVAGLNEHNIDNNPDNIYNWHRILISFEGHNRDVEISNLKLKFKDGYVGSVVSSINNGYIQPLVTVSNRLAPSYRLFPTIMDIINDNGTTGLGIMYPKLYIHVKPKKAQLVGIIFNSNKDILYSDGARIDEIRNFDMSITPTE